MFDGYIYLLLTCAICFSFLLISQWIDKPKSQHKGPLAITVKDGVLTFWYESVTDAVHGTPKMISNVSVEMKVNK